MFDMGTIHASIDLDTRGLRRGRQEALQAFAELGKSADAATRAAIVRPSVDTSKLNDGVKKTGGILGGFMSTITALPRGLGAVMGSVSKLASAFGTLGFAVFGIKQTAMAFAGLISGMVAGNIAFEQYYTQFAVLLRGTEDFSVGVEKAKVKIAELAKFAAETPFNLPEIVESSKLLRTFGGAALDTIETLKMVGDMAAGVGRPFQEIAFWVGRVYTNIKAGKPFGEAALRLQEMGLLSGEARAELEALTESGASSDVVWAKFGTTMGRFGGMMEQLSMTLGGLISTLKDEMGSLQRDVFQSLMENVKTVVDDSIGFLQSDAVHEAGKKFGAALGQGFAFAYQQMLIGINRLIDSGTKLVNWFKTYFWPELQQLDFSNLFRFLAEVKTPFQNLLEVLPQFTPVLQQMVAAFVDLFNAFGPAMVGVFMAFGEALRIIAAVLAPIANLMAAHTGLVRAMVFAWVAFKGLGLVSSFARLVTQLAVTGQIMAGTTAQTQLWSATTATANVRLAATAVSARVAALSFQGLALSLRAMFVAMGPVGWAITGITAVLTLFPSLIGGFGGTEKAVEGVNEALEEMNFRMRELPANAPAVTKIGTAFKEVEDKVNEVMARTRGEIEKYLKSWGTAFSGTDQAKILGHVDAVDDVAKAWQQLNAIQTVDWGTDAKASLEEINKELEAFMTLMGQSEFTFDEVMSFLRSKGASALPPVIDDLKKFQEAFEAGQTPAMNWGKKIGEELDLVSKHVTDAASSSKIQMDILLNAFKGSGVDFAKPLTEEWKGIFATILNGTNLSAEGVKKLVHELMLLGVIPPLMEDDVLKQLAAAGVEVIKLEEIVAGSGVGEAMAGQAEEAEKAAKRIDDAIGKLLPSLGQTFDEWRAEIEKLSLAYSTFENNLGFINETLVKSGIDNASAIIQGIRQAGPEIAYHMAYELGQQPLNAVLPFWQKVGPVFTATLREAEGPMKSQATATGTNVNTALATSLGAPMPSGGLLASVQATLFAVYEGAKAYASSVGTALGQIVANDMAAGVAGANAKARADILKSKTFKTADDFKQIYDLQTQMENENRAAGTGLTSGQIRDAIASGNPLTGVAPVVPFNAPTENAFGKAAEEAAKSAEKTAEDIAKAAADVVRTVSEAIMTAMEMFNKLTAFRPTVNWGKLISLTEAMKSTIIHFGNALAGVGDELMKSLGGFNEKITTGDDSVDRSAKGWAETANTIFSALSNVIDSFSKLNDLDMSRFDWGKLTTLGVFMREAIFQFSAALQATGQEMVTATADWAEKAGTAITALTAGVDLFDRLRTFRPEGIETWPFTSLLRHIIGELGGFIDEWSIEAAHVGARWAEAAGVLLDAMLKGLDVLERVRTFQPDLQTWPFTSLLRHIVHELGSFLDEWAIQAAEFGARWAAGAGVLLDAMVKGLDVLERVRAFRPDIQTWPFTSLLRWIVSELGNQIDWWQIHAAEVGARWASSAGIVIDALVKGFEVFERLRNFRADVQTWPFTSLLRFIVAELGYHVAWWEQHGAEIGARWAVSAGYVIDVLVKGFEVFERLRDFRPDDVQTWPFTSLLRFIVAELGWHVAWWEQYGAEVGARWAASAGIVVDVLVKGFEVFERLRDFRSDGVQTWAFTSLLRWIVAELGFAIDYWQQVGADTAARWASSAGIVVDTLLRGFELFRALERTPRLPALSNLIEFVKNVVATVQFVTGQITLALVDAAEKGGRWADSAAKIFSLMTVALEAFDALRRLGSVKFDNATKFITGLKSMVTLINSQLDNSIISLTDRAARWAESMEKVVSLIKSGVDAFTALRSFSPSANASAFLADLVNLVRVFALVSDRFGVELTDKSLRFAEQAQVVVTLMKSAVEAFSSGLDRMPVDVGTKVGKLVSILVVAVRAFAGGVALIKEENVFITQGMAEAAASLVGAIASFAGALQNLSGVGSRVEQSVARLVVMLVTSIRAFAFGMRQFDLATADGVEKFSNAARNLVESFGILSNIRRIPTSEPFFIFIRELLGGFRSLIEDIKGIPAGDMDRLKEWAQSVADFINQFLNARVASPLPQSGALPTGGGINVTPVVTQGLLTSTAQSVTPLGGGAVTQQVTNHFTIEISALDGASVRTVVPEIAYELDRHLQRQGSPGLA